MFKYPSVSPPALTGIPSLDSYLATVERPVNGSVISINGPLGSGKTHLLYFLVATCVLPANHLSLPVGGWNKAAFILDLDGHFQISRFHDILVNRLQQFLPTLDVTSCVERCLSYTHIFRPTSSGHLAATLLHLQRYHTKHCPDVDLGMVAVHSIGAFMWFDRFTAEQLRSTSAKVGAMPSLEIFSSLERLRVDNGLSIVLTDWGLSQQVQSASNVTQYQSDDSEYASTSTYPEVVDISASLTQAFTNSTSALHHISLKSVGRPSKSDKSGEMLWIVRVSDTSRYGIVAGQIMTHGMVVK